MTHPFYRPEPAITLSNLPHLRQSVLYVFPEKSAMATPQLQKEKMKRTGVGVGGSSGEKAGAVVREVLRGAGHLCVFEKDRVGECAEISVRWLEAQLRVLEERDEKEKWEKAIGEVEWKEKVQEWMKRRRKGKGKL
ncbi:hypothetical protein ABVK25_010422 [Lepraria finkii]|uniref:Uncharacterized protein n=1 Tax=Lepraria finkii TaxID=1340010 RepID=A0ABR4AUF6_9LECA